MDSMELPSITIEAQYLTKQKINRKDKQRRCTYTDLLCMLFYVYCIVFMYIKY